MGRDGPLGQRIFALAQHYIKSQHQDTLPAQYTTVVETTVVLCARLQASSLRDRVVDVAEELLKFGLLLRPHSEYLVDRYRLVQNLL